MMKIVDAMIMVVMSCLVNHLRVCKQDWFCKVYESLNHSSIYLVRNN